MSALRHKPCSDCSREAVPTRHSLPVGSTRTPTLAMPSAFSWPVLVPSALRAPAPVNLGVMWLGNIPSETDVDTRLHQAAEVGGFAVVKSLLSQACAINAIDICGRTPLHFAAANNQLEMVEYLISVGADVNGQADGEGWQDHAPLGYAVGTCSTDMIQRLLQLGADPKCAGWMGLTALDLAKDRIDEEGRMFLELLQKKCLDESANT